MRENDFQHSFWPQLILGTSNTLTYVHAACKEEEGQAWSEQAAGSHLSQTGPQPEQLEGMEQSAAGLLWQLVGQAVRQLPVLALPPHSAYQSAAVWRLQHRQFSRMLQIVHGSRLTLETTLYLIAQDADNAYGRFSKPDLMTFAPRPMIAQLLCTGYKLCPLLCSNHSVMQ